MKPKAAQMPEQRPWWETRWTNSDGSLYANGVSYQAYYSEVGKAHYMGKDLTEVRSLQRKLVPDKVGLDQCEPTSLRGIATKAKAGAKHRFQDLYRCLNAQFLMNCWKDLNKNAASGVDKVTAEAYWQNLQANIQNLAKRLKEKRYRAKLVRRCYIPKDNGKERPLGIPALEDRLLQLACAKIVHPETGTPQGGIVSPVLANVYLHFGLDLWFQKRVKAHCKGDAFIVR
jgi:retron-type reverse transcriptase